MAGMSREEVIARLNDLHGVASGLGGDQCYLNGIGIKQLQALIDGATELLKGQELRMMTLAEALAADYVYLEIKLHASLPCECCILAVDPDGGILPLHKGFCAYLDGEDYGIDWRCWTSRPTDEQREATPWHS